MRLVFFQPDIPQNLGAAIRLTACLALELEVIEPLGFPLSEKGLRRAALDYGDGGLIRRHASWDAFLAFQRERGGRIILFTTRGAEPYLSARFRPDDALLFGRESAGVPEAVHQDADLRLYIPLRPGARSLNVVTAAAMAAGEALRQVGGLGQ